MGTNYLHLILIARSVVVGQQVQDSVEQEAKGHEAAAMDGT